MRWYRVVGAVVVAMLAWAAPASADADTFEVNLTSDQDDLTANDLCDVDAGTVGAQCTFRAAVQEASDGDPLVESDTIAFDAALVGQTIELTSSLPAAAGGEINESVLIDGCSSMPAALIPCVGIRYGDAVAGGPFNLLQVNGGNVTVRGLALTNAATAINVAGGSSFSLQKTWLGVRIDATTADAANDNVTGLRVSADNATIGGVTQSARNVFVNSSQSGLRVVRADGVSVKGSYFGVKPDGQTPASNLEENIEVVGASGDRPTNTLIGGRVSAAAASTGECDEDCNVIAAAVDNVDIGLDLAGDQAQSEIASTGAVVRGNYFGYAGDGSSTAVSNPYRNGTAIRVADAINSTIGGPGAAGNPDGDRNYIASGNVGIVAFGQNPVVQNNLIGLDRNGTAVRPFNNASGLAMNIGSLSGAGIQILDNFVSAGSSGAQGISLSGEDAVVQGNKFGSGVGGQDLGAGTGGSVALRTVETTEIDDEGEHIIGGSGAGQGNTFRNTTLRAVSMEGTDDSIVRGNSFLGGSGAAIWIDTFISTTANGNTVGGDAAGQANTFASYTGGADAIRITGDGNDGNRIEANTGSVSGHFIDLGNDGTGNDSGTGPNDGVQPPLISAAGPNRTRGTAARPNATVRVFRKATSADGEVGALLGSAQADGSGSWTVNYSGTNLTAADNVTATQTDTNGNSSELRTPEQPVDATPPATQIDGGPSQPTADATPTFTYSATGADAGTAEFECSVDLGTPAFAACPGTGNGSFTSGTLADGSYTFRVRATDQAGNTDSTAESRAFSVDTQGPPVTIESGPEGTTTEATPTFTFSSAGADSVACRIVPAGGSAEFRPCTGNGTHTSEVPLSPGAYTFEVRGADALGNVGPAAARTFTVRAPDDGTTPDTDPPETTVKKTKVKGDDAKITFTSDEPGSTFTCKLDRKKAKPCTSPRKVKNLDAGRHKLVIRATDPAGNTDPSAAKAKFRIDD